LRGFAKLSSLFSFLALLSALLSRIDLPAFLAAPLLGDFPDIGITPFFACVTQYHTYLYFLSQSAELRLQWQRAVARGLDHRVRYFSN
jgi:hypothetical protein